jgi:Bacteriophage Lambda NinG protein
MKQHTCKVCKAKYTKTRPLQKVCGIECAKSLAKLKNFNDRKKAEAKSLKERKEAILTRSDWVKKAQVAVNAYVRARDAGLPCISCGATPEARFGGATDAGHYRSTGSAPHLRFLTTQIRAQCVRCNRHLAGNAIEFRRGLIERIGVEKVEEIESMQGQGKWSIEYLQRLTKLMAKKKRRTEKRNDSRK